MGTFFDRRFGVGIPMLHLQIDRDDLGRLNSNKAADLFLRHFVERSPVLNHLVELHSDDPVPGHPTKRTYNIIVHDNADLLALQTTMPISWLDCSTGITVTQVQPLVVTLRLTVDQRHMAPANATAANHSLLV